MFGGPLQRELASLSIRLGVGGCGRTGGCESITYCFPMNVAAVVFLREECSVQTVFSCLFTDLYRFLQWLYQLRQDGDVSYRVLVTPGPAVMQQTGCKPEN